MCLIENLKNIRASHFGERSREEECVRNVDRLKRVENILCPQRKVKYQEKLNFRIVATGSCLTTSISSFGNKQKILLKNNCAQHNELGVSFVVQVV